MNPKVVVLVIVGGVALGAAAFAVVRPDRKAVAAPVTPLSVQLKEKRAVPAPAPQAPARMAPPPPLPGAPVQTIQAPPSVARPAAQKLVVAQADPRDAAIAIPDGKTLDFSTGAPITRDADKDKIALDAGLREIELATQGTIPPATRSSK